MAANPQTQRLAGKVAVIAGAASGIGKAAAAEFVRNGAKVILADVQDDLGRSVAAELGPDTDYTRCDVSDEAQIAAAVDLAVERHGRLDTLQSNLGVSGSPSQTSVGALDLDDFDRLITVNARSTVACMKHGARVMAPGRRGGSILCTASVIGVLSFGSPILAYAISKATVIAAVRAAAGPGAGERHLAARHRDAAHGAVHGRGRAEAGGGEGLERARRYRAGGGGRGQGGAVPGVRRGHVRDRAQPAPGRRVHCPQGCQHAVAGGVEPLRRDRSVPQW